MSGFFKNIFQKLGTSGGALLVGATGGAWGTVQGFIAALLSSVGAGIIGFIQLGVGAIARTLQDKNREWVSVKDFGAFGNSNGTTGNGADDTGAIQAALDYMGSIGGGTVRLVNSSGAYRVTSVLRLPSFVTLEGVSSDRYPYSPGFSGICADFAVTTQWVIESKSLLNGTNVPFNVTIKVSDTYTYSYNCGVKNLTIKAVNTIPYGAIRMMACPGSIVENVSVVGTGAGLLVNQCYGGSYNIHTLTYYYGVIAWQDVNANNFDVYCTQYGVFSSIIPAGYVMPFMSALNGSMVGAYKLSTEEHYRRTWGFICGASGSTSTGNRIKLTVEQFSGGAFQILTYGNVFEHFYVESVANVMSFACVATVSRFIINGLHAYMSNTGKVFDLGVTLNARVTAIGFIDYAQYGFGPFNDASSLVTIDGIAEKDFGPAIPQSNLVYTSGGRNWTAPTYSNSWVANAGSPPAYRLNSRTGNVELRGIATGGVVESAAFTLPAGFRPSFTRRFSACSGTEFLILANGQVIPTAPTTTGCVFDGFTFAAEL